MERIHMPAALLAFRLRSRLGCRKQVLASDRGRLTIKMRSTIYALSLFIICAALGEDSDPNRTKIAYIPCAQNEEPTFSVTLDYNIKDFTKGTQVIYFKRTVSPQGSFSISGYHGIGCGRNGSLSTSVSSNARDDGIHFSLRIHQTGNDPNEYSTKILIPWNAVDYLISDDRATINANFKWK